MSDSVSILKDSGPSIGIYAGISVAAFILLLIIIFFPGMLLGALLHRWISNRRTRKFNLSSNNDTSQAASCPVVYEEVSHDSHIERNNSITVELKENVAYGPLPCTRM